MVYNLISYHWQVSRFSILRTFFLPPFISTRSTGFWRVPIYRSITYWSLQLTYSCAFPRCSNKTSLILKCFCTYKLDVHNIFSNCSFFWNPFEPANLQTLKKLLANANEPTTWRPAEASVELRRFTSFPSPAGVFDSCGISNFTLKLDTWFQSLGSSHYSYEKNCSNTFDFEKG